MPLIFDKFPAKITTFLFFLNFNGFIEIFFLIIGRFLIVTGLYEANFLLISGLAVTIFEKIKADTFSKKFIEKERVFLKNLDLK
jgi:hypothetical protein